MALFRAPVGCVTFGRARGQRMDDQILALFQRPGRNRKPGSRRGGWGRLGRPVIEWPFCLARISPAGVVLTTTRSLVALRRESLAGI